jgi:hypothetical protein
MSDKVVHQVNEKEFTFIRRLLGYHDRDLCKLIEAVPSITDRQVYDILKDRAETIAEETDYSLYSKRTIHEYFDLIGHRFDTLTDRVKTRKELAVEMGITGDRVRQLESKIFIRLWRWLDSISKSRCEAIMFLVSDN